VFNPAGGSGQHGSASDPEIITVGKDATAAALAVSNTAPETGATVTYTATVTPTHPGASAPTGSVDFVDNGAPIDSCASRPLTSGSATCTLSYAAAGGHEIGAVYGGDRNFSAATSPAHAVTVTAASGGGPGPGGGPTAAQVLAGLRSQLAPTGKRAKIRAILRHRAFSPAFTALTAGSVRIQWFALRRGAHLSKAKRVEVARGTRSYGAAGTRTVNLRLTRAGLRLLKRAKRLKLTAKGTFVLPDGTGVAATKTFVLER
jgi:hypothetical protein